MKKAIFGRQFLLRQDINRQISPMIIGPEMLNMILKTYILKGNLSLHYMMVVCEGLRSGRLLRIKEKQKMH